MLKHIISMTENGIKIYLCHNFSWSQTIDHAKRFHEMSDAIDTVRQLGAGYCIESFEE